MIRLLLIGITFLMASAALAAELPHKLVLITCKGHIEPWPNEVDTENAKRTGAENWQWDYPGSKMLCKRQEIQLYDPAEGMPQPGPSHGDKNLSFPLYPNFADATQCARAGVRLSMDWDDSHRNTAWRVWRVGCPTPIMDMRTGAIIGYKMPDGGHREIVTFLIDSEI